jgi:hypothetical protein
MSTTDRFATPSAEHLRKQAKDLKRLIAQGDHAAIERVRRSHPRQEHLALDTFVLRDAQVVLAREAGFPGWSQLIAALTPPPPPDPLRWSRRGERRLFDAVFRSAREHGSSTVHTWHIVRILAYPESPTVASEALWACGLDADRLETAMAITGHRKPSGLPEGISSTPAQQMIFARAEGLALAAGTSITDEQMLVALMYDGDGRDLAGLSLTLDGLYSYLAERGVNIPSRLPPPQPRPFRHEQRIYVPSGEAGRAFHETIVRFHHSNDRKWGLNKSTARRGDHYYDAETTIDLAAIARATLNDDEWELMTVTQGAAMEDAARSDAGGA